MDIEEALRQAEVRAAMLRYLSDLAARSPETPDPPVLNGIGEVCEDIERLTRTARRSLSVGALGTEVES